MNQKVFLERRDKWLDEVSNQCHVYASQTNVDYYVFQTSCDEYNPPLMIIGINPGGGKTYEQILSKENWTRRPLKSLKYNVNTLISKPIWEIQDKEKGADFMRSRLKNVFTSDNGMWSVLENAVMMNMCFFNTKDEVLLNNKITNEIQQYCQRKTIEFIDILNPQNVLILTSSNKNLSKLNDINPVPVSRYIKSGLINERVVYSIPHYAARTSAYSREVGPEIGHKIFSLLYK
jgi:hypothetical protein